MTVEGKVRCHMRSVNNFGDIPRWIREATPITQSREPTVRNVEYPVVMKVIDILGNDTTKTLTVEIKSAKHLSS